MKSHNNNDPVWLRRMLATAGCAAMLVASPLALAQDTNGSASTGSASKKGMDRQSDMQMKSMPADMHKAMESSDMQMKSMKMTGDVDRDYAMMMRTHHQGAVDMSKVLIANGRDPEMKRMARKIMSNNEKEIAQFDQWLNKQKDAKGTVDQTRKTMP